MDDQPVQQPQGDQDEDHKTEVISNAIHHLVAKSAKDTRLPIFPLLMLPRNLSRSTYQKTGGDSRVTVQ